MSRNRISKEVLEFGTTQLDWRFFIYDEYTAPILTNLFEVPDILNFNILMMQRIESTRSKSEYPAVYFVELNKMTYKTIKHDIKNELYTEYYIITTNESDYKFSELSNVHVSLCLFNFIPQEERVFLFACGVSDCIKSLESVLNCSFVINFPSHLKKCVSEVLKNYIETERGDSDVLLLNRSCDLNARLIHTFGYESLLKDFAIIYEKDSLLYKKLRHLHLAEINQVLLKKSHEIIGQSKELDKNIDQKRLIEMVLQAPEQIELKENINKHLNLADKIFDRYDEDMKRLITIEQNICTRYTSDGYNYKTGVADCMALFESDKISKNDKTRLLLLIGLKYEFSKSEISNLKARGLFSFTELGLLPKIRKGEHLTLKQKNKFTYELSRYQLNIYSLINDVIEEKDTMERIGKRPEVVKSLRRSNFVFSMKKRRIICVIFMDAVTYPEIQAVYEISRSNNVDVIVGARDIITPHEFIHELKHDL